MNVLGALAGGAIFQWLFGFNFSVAVWVGYIACFGMAVETGVVMLVYLREAIEERGGLARITSIADLRQAILEGAVHRLRPKLLTEGAAILSIAPMLWAAGPEPRSSGPWPRPCWAGCSSPTRSSTSSCRSSTSPCRKPDGGSWRDPIGTAPPRWSRARYQRRLDNPAQPTNIRIPSAVFGSYGSERSRPTSHGIRACARGHPSRGCPGRGFVRRGLRADRCPGWPQWRRPPWRRAHRSAWSPDEAEAFARP